LNAGMDLVCVADVLASMTSFGEAYAKRLLCDAERATLVAPSACRARQCALMFAGKEAALKAFALADMGVDWRDIEVNIQGMVLTGVGLHGRAAELAVAHGCHAWRASGHVNATYAMALVMVE
jgi:phosphopantetheinyl transferase (holo-ACP synthase)